MISYEIPLALSIVGVLILAGSMSLVEIVKAQEGLWFIVRQPLGFVLFLICISAETNRTPFDLLECENELVAGYQTEYPPEVRALLHGRVRPHPAGFVPGEPLLPGRLERPAAAGPPVAADQGVFRLCAVHLGRATFPASATIS